MRRSLYPSPYRNPFRNPVPLLVLGLLAGLAAPLPGNAAALPQTPPSPGTDAAAVVRRAVANQLAAESTGSPMRFVLHKHDERHDYTQQVIETPQGDVALAVAVHDAPLSAALHQVQIDRLNALAQNPALQEHRLHRELEDNVRVNKLLRLLPDAFLYHYDRTVPCIVTVPPDVPVPGEPSPAPVNGQAPSQCYHFTFTPNPNFNPPDAESKIFQGMAGELWIEASQERLFRLNAHLTADVDFGWGIIGRLNQGGTVYLEQTDLGDEWQLTRMKLNLTGKALMVKALSYHITEEMAHFAPVSSHLDYRDAIKMLESEHAPE